MLEHRGSICRAQCDRRAFEEGSSMTIRIVLTTWITTAFVCLGVVPAEAQVTVGKKISTAIVANSGPVSSVPYTDFLTVAVPTSYKSKSNVLKVTTSYLASCGPGDQLSSHVEVGGWSIADGNHDVECDSETVRVTKVYFLPKESEGGTVVAPAANVVVKLSSVLGTCGALHGVMTVEAAK
jgi:hypothetical protein